MNFLKNLLAAVLGCLIAFGMLFGLLLVVVALISVTEQGVRVKNNTVLELSFTHPVVDYTGRKGTDPLSNFIGGYETGLDEILHTLQVAQNDPHIQGISLTTSYLQAGMTQIREIRKALLDFKATGKFIYAYGDFYTQKEYYLASAADSIYINPMGVLDFRGLSTEVLYVKDLQEKSGVKMEVIRHGKYKSAVEPYISNTMSDENRTQLQELLSTIWETLAKDISTSRNIPLKDLNRIADTLGGRTPAYAAASGLVDGYFHVDAYEALLKKQMGVEPDEELHQISFADYIPLADKKQIPSGKHNIAVIYAQGEILYGEGGKDFIGQGTLTTALREARDEKNVKAIVLRINSPGGSALVSDMIWREVELAKAHKPVVVSFGNVAASGGYYIGVGGDKIFAEPTTITGSIGVFGTIPNINQLATKVGIHAEQVGTHKNAVDYSFFEPVEDTFRKVLEENIEAIYTTFVRRVAEGRNMTPAEVEAVAQGRVWSGTDALENGLIDELGSLEDAIAAAAEMVNLKQYNLLKYPRYKSTLEQMLESLHSVKIRLGEKFMEEKIGKEAYQFLKEFKQISEKEGVQARLPFSLTIQ